MIFGKNYDSSLWLILVSDKDNREEIIKFIKDIPKELYVKLMDSMIKYQEIINVDGEFKGRKALLCGEFVDDKMDLYSFYINLDDGMLSLCRSVLNKYQRYYIDIEVSLIPCKLDDNLGFLDGKLIGEIIFALDERKNSFTFDLKDYSYNEYECMKIPFGNALVFCKSDTKRRVRRINRKNMKDDYNLTDFDC